MRALYLLVLLCFSSLHALAGDDPLAHLKKGQPKDVIELIDRLVGCNHWSGEEAYDAERGQEIASGLADLKCERLEKDEAALRKRYAKRPSTIKVLQKAKDTTY
jgi:hypothetical protein